MNNGQTKPGYNLQISTSKQFVTHFDLYHNPTDTLTLIPFLEGYMTSYPNRQKETTADSGYGSEENYTFFEDHDITAFVKYNYFHKEQQGQQDNQRKPQLKPIEKKGVRFADFGRGAEATFPTSNRTGSSFWSDKDLYGV